MKLMLINKDNPLPKDYKPELQEVCEGYFMEAHAACAMKKMLCAALRDGIRLRVFSAYRSISYQKGLFNENVDRYMLSGMSYEEAAAALRIPLSTLRGRIHRGRGQLRKELNAE